MTRKTFLVLSYVQTIFFILVFLYGAIKIVWLDKGGAYGISGFIFLIFYLPSLLLLIPDILLIVKSSVLSHRQRIGGYFFHVAAIAWSIFLIHLAF
ncbi:hypothetical protein [Gloeothece verrucosa]|uniref:Uncharacterized protein n=1 Tax=Gloeothece verrucosa (strain PCC 7822) TaxID=497965 RepID=E0UKQ7_GLOV7|nr:hypothetical protein [Gloeothece verrucosa]ADN17537.1 hypothetical protein Cyan7822_5674 [Gloeothece verrucosa PCC 7822]